MVSFLAYGAGFLRHCAKAFPAKYRMTGRLNHGAGLVAVGAFATDHLDHLAQAASRIAWPSNPLAKATSAAASATGYSGNLAC